MGFILALYCVLLITPIPLPFARDHARAIIQNSLPAGSEIQLGGMSLALEGGVLPVLQFSPVVYTDGKVGAKVSMKALDVGFSPFRTLIGQPAAVVSIVEPHIQMVQDLFGPRLSNFVIENGTNGAPATVRIIEGETAFPPVAISAQGLDIRGGLPSDSPGLRSDNDWLIYNMESMEQSLADVVQMRQQGLFSSLSVRDATIDMHDTVYGLYRQFTDLNFTMKPGDADDDLSGEFTAVLGGRTVSGSVERTIDDQGRAHLSSSVVNLDFATLLPFLDDPDSTAAIRGTGALSVEIDFDNANGKVRGGKFYVDLTGMDVRINEDMFPVVSSILEVDWTPETGQFILDEGELMVGQSSARVSGAFALGLDKVYGPTVGISIMANNVKLHPNDLDAPDAPIDSVTFSGWSAPLYGALGIDQMLAVKGEGKVAVRGRVDTLRTGMGFDLTLAGEKMSADDIKRLWPYFLSPDARDWFVKSVTKGSVKTAAMKFNFPVGTIGKPGEDKPIPPGAITIDMAGEGVAVALNPGLPAIPIDGETRLQVRDAAVTVVADGTTVDTGKGPLAVTNAAVIIDNSVIGEQVIEISGQLKTAIPALLAITREQQPNLLNEAEMPINPDALNGDVTLNAVATLQIRKDDPEPDIDYVLTGSVADFRSDEPIETRSIGKGQLAFTATQHGYQVKGTAEVDTVPAEMSIEGQFEGAPNMVFSAALDTAKLKEFGLDASAFLSGSLVAAAKPKADGTIDLSVDLTKAGLTIKDIGITKAAGIPGTLEATAKITGDVTELTNIKLAFGDVALSGSLKVDAKAGLQSAEFDRLQLGPGDNASASVAAVDGGYSIRVRGKQLDLKPMLQRFFSLSGGSTGGVSAEQIRQTLILDVRLDQALGFYKTTAFNLNLDMSLRGSDLRRVNLQANFGGDRNISVTTNNTPDGKVMSVAFNDLGTVLRLLGVYPRLEGGEGTFVMSTNDQLKADAGQVLIHNFALIDEANVVQVLGNHEGSRALIANQNKLSFHSAEVHFIRRKDRIEITEGLLSGDMVGGTVRGFIYTEQRAYDLVGTYVPLFGLNNVFQKIPLFGPLLGGREGEGLIGVTFAIRGSLDNPVFNINPASALLPGAFRSLFEFRAREQPRTE